MYYVTTRTIIAGAIVLTIFTGLILYFLFTQFFQDPNANDAEASEIASPEAIMLQDVWADYEVVTRTIEGRSVRLLVADSPSKRKQGLMYVRNLEEYDGMLFTFEVVGIRAFWNQNTFLPLELVWVNNGEVIGRDRLPSIEQSNGEIITIESPGEVTEVIELVVQ